MPQSTHVISGDLYTRVCALGLTFTMPLPTHARGTWYSTSGSASGLGEGGERGGEGGGEEQAVPDLGLPLETREGWPHGHVGVPEIVDDDCAELTV